jgi:ferrous iron transport protein A
MEKQDSLRALRPGERAVVTSLRHGEEMARRLKELGFLPGTAVTCVAHSPAGDPAAYLVRGAVIALRGQDAALVEAVPLPREAPVSAPVRGQWA